MAFEVFSRSHFFLSFFASFQNSSGSRIRTYTRLLSIIASDATLPLSYNKFIASSIKNDYLAPKVGYEILKEIEFPWPVAQIVYQHHERWNGSGYPQGLSDDQILLEARILAVADVVEAMASHRPYRPPLGIEKALEELSENRGKLYDSRVVDACIRVFKEKNYTFK